MNINLFIGLIILFVLIIFQIIIILFFDIEVKKRRIFLVLDFLSILLVYSGILLWITVVKPLFFIPLVIIFFTVYNIILFKIIKRIILINRVKKIKEEVNDALIESLKSLAELDYKSAYEILDEAIERHPDSKELINLRNFLDKRLKIIVDSKKKLLK
ncbi:MAG TPA: hypothetical protein PLE45_05510 [Spirochaetota bacterium]|nr:hypothetical protein [Spirochaetota bacterium]HOL57124.1 hypothetical protein [Spirochaetota bacterium]HPP04729.1 hypothetical protein [Spirochaetota bacterium]